MLVGTTEYDYQSNGSSGKRVAYDGEGGVHFAWMSGIGYPNNRSIYFNYMDADSNWLVPQAGLEVSQRNGAGYNQIGLTTDNRAAVAYHESAGNYITLAIDAFPGFGIFSYFDPPDLIGSERFYWPYIAVDRIDNIHVIGTVNPASGVVTHTLGYTRSVDAGSTWTALQAVDTTTTLSAVTVSSRVSDKTAMVYSRPFILDSTPAAAQYFNDIYYIESLDGITWNWASDKVNVTGYDTSDDSLAAYTDLAAIYDYNDNLHIIWNAQWTIDSPEGVSIYYKTFLLHYDNGSSIISEITSSDSAWADNCSWGVWNRPICKMSLAVYEGAPNALVAVYTKFDTIDCSAGGYANGDLYMQFSLDSGALWDAEINMTDSHTPGCQPGDCDSDHWSSMADRAGDYLHIVYIEDKDAGGVPQTEGTVTLNPVKYLAFPNPVVGIEDDIIEPKTFSLSQNYPNPFNAGTNIDFELEKDSQVEIVIYDITGARVGISVDRLMSAGFHSVKVDAGDIASGVYYYRMSANGESLSRKMVLLK